MSLTDLPTAAPSRKVLASGAGGGFALLLGNLLVWALGEYVFGPDPVPQEVSAFVLGGLPLLAGFAAAYFTPRGIEEVAPPYVPGQHVRPAGEDGSTRLADVIVLLALLAIAGCSLAALGALR